MASWLGKQYLGQKEQANEHSEEIDKLDAILKNLKNNAIHQETK